MIEPRAMKKMLRALEMKDFELVQSLVVQGMGNPNALMPGKGVGLLHLIIGHRSENFAFVVTKLFLRCGGDPNVRSADGVTPIHVAAAWGRNRILHLLLINGGDPWLQDEEKKNAFNYAFEERKWSTIEMLHHFQQMHSAASWKKDAVAGKKYDLSSERVLLRKGNDKFAFVPIEKFTTSTTTQTQCDVQNMPSSPVQDKIKFFEPLEGLSEPFLSADEKRQQFDIGWTKDFYQTSCEVIVHHDDDVHEAKEKSSKTFVSSIRIDPSPPNPGNFQKIKSSLDVRSQLFVELEEAVRKRSKSKAVREDLKNLVGNSVLGDSVLLKSDSGDKDSDVGKETSYLYGVDLKDNKMLKNMSDFATKVMKEIKFSEANGSSHVTIDLCSSSPELGNAYATCDEESRNVLSPQVLDESNLYLTPYSSNLSNNFDGNKSKEENSNESFVSVSEEYKYAEVEKGMVLMEKKFPLTPTVSLALGQSEENPVDFPNDDDSLGSSIPDSIGYNSDVLRCELTGLGYTPGPVTKTTKKLYLRKLKKLKKKTKEIQKEKTKFVSVFPPPLESTLADAGTFEGIPGRRALEEEMCRSFVGWNGKKWREGASKTSFNYLLLDPRISSNLPKRALESKAIETWKSFLSAIFYVGKGKRSRPYAHLYQATAFWDGKSCQNVDKKIKRIVDIWKEGLGVVCLHVFQNIMPVEAFTREAAMIDALGLSNLDNARAGEYYGVVSTWPDRDKVELGIYLLHKAMLIFLSEGERQIKPFDID